MELIITDSLYIATFVILVPVWFKILQAMRVEQIFTKGKVEQIRAFYILTSLICAKLSVDAIFTIVYKMQSIFNLNV